jgi:hypothetical protein
MFGLIVYAAGLLVYHQFLVHIRKLNYMHGIETIKFPFSCSFNINVLA